MFTKKSFINFKKTKKLINKIIKKEKKNISRCLIFILMGVIIGGGIVYAYYNNSNISRDYSYKADMAEAAAYLRFKEIRADFMPSGVPDIYGNELDVSFDDVQDAIDKMIIFDPTYGEDKIILEGSDLERYISIGSQTSCQFCCGAKTLVFEDGEAACGCAHSQAMRGLGAYLIKNHSELSDEQILKELNTWKRTYFPKQTLSEKLLEMEKAGEPGIKELLEEFPDFLPQMVGGC